MPEFLTGVWPALAALANLGITVWAAGHAILNKSDERAAVGWVGLIVLIPIGGAVIYYLFGINRIYRRARELRQGFPIVPLVSGEDTSEYGHREPDTERMPGLRHLSPQIYGSHYVSGNNLRMFRNGDEAYPAMIEAIENAEKSIAICSYIFNNDTAGNRFLCALLKAKERGVEVRAMIDGIGAFYSRPPLSPKLKDAGIPVALYLFSWLPWQMPYLNMRNHQKLLIVDGRTGFTGSMNIAVGNLVSREPKMPILDVHFEVKGPVVAQLMNTFGHEWTFTTGERLEGELWFPELAEEGDIEARGITGGPDVALNPIRWMMLGALTAAERRVRIMTPYFVPDPALQTALSLAARRGVDVDVVMPEKNDLPFVKWAATAQMDGLIDAGCRLWYTQGPFEHTKLMTVDDYWSFVGSANWDTRSLRLNFEFNLECFSEEFATDLGEFMDGRRESARPITLEELKARPFRTRLRDGTVHLFAPYL